jgi:hypothetical protein
MRSLLLLAALLLVSVGVFAVRGREALAARDQAHEDLLARERKLDELQRELGSTEADFDGLREEHTRIVALAGQRLQLLEGQGEGKAPPRLDEALASAPFETLRPGGTLHDSLRAQAGLPADAQAPAPEAASAREIVLAQLVQLLAVAGPALNVDRLALRGEGPPANVAGVPELGQLDALLEVSGALPDVLAALEALAPLEGGGPVAITVKDASLRRIEPSSWGENLHRLATPPVRLSASLEVLLRAPGGS